MKDTNSMSNETRRQVICCIMAGGRGERFWPDSRRDHPKQLLRIGTEKTLVETTVDNLSPLLQRDQIVISTSPDLESPLRKVLPDLEFWTEPAPRDTAACIGYCTYKSLKYDKDTVLIFVGSDYHIADKVSFQQHLATAIEFARQGKIVTLGIKPDRPATGYGYIQTGKMVSGPDSDHRVYEVERFVEKPDYKTALEYLEKEYLWNSGMFIVKASTMIKAFRKHLVGHYEVLEKINTIDFDPVKSLELFETLQRISIDYGIMEKETQNLVVIKSTFVWDDLGDWTALERHYEPDPSNNLIIGSNCLALETKDCIIKSNKAFIATYGVKDLIIVENNGAILIMPKNESQKIKKILENIAKDDSFHQYL
ncbi:MAG: mannose-1-phosphate guanylyltransferase [Candidatus Odinarchaeota archaeon]